MNRTLLLLLLVIGLSVSAWFLLKDQDQSPATSVLGMDRNFSVNRDLVYKVFLADRSGNRTTLERKADGWIYNGKYKARKDAIGNLLSAIHQIRMQYVPTKAAVPYMIESLASHGIKVEVYGKNGENLKTYYVGGATSDELGTYIIMEGSEQPYVGELEHWTGNLRFRYNLLGDDWRDRSLFASQADDIAEISIDYPKQQNKSFRLNLRDGKQELSPYYPLSPRIQQPIKNGAITSFTHVFEGIFAARFNNYNKDRDSIEQQIPFAIINLEEKDGDRFSLRLFPENQKPFYDSKSGNFIQPEGIDSYFGLTGNDDFMNIQNSIISKILWGYDFFYE